MLEIDKIDRVPLYSIAKRFNINPITPNKRKSCIAFCRNKI